jgi:methyl halide transferase
MDLRHLKIHLIDRHIRAVVADGTGEHGRDIDGDPFDRVAEAAAPLLGAIESRLGGACHLALRAISIDPLARVLRVSIEDDQNPGARFEGAEYSAMAPQIAVAARAAMNELRERKPDLVGSTPSDAIFWSSLYASGGDGWELGRATPPLERWFTAHPPREQRTLVIGCGRGHEARMLARMGAHVVAIDFAPEAIAAAQGYADSDAVDFRVRDLFALPRDVERYDLIVEHTCFCAIDPARRDEYVDVVHQILKPQGRLVGLFYAHGRPGGPPFSTTLDELRTRFTRKFLLAHDEVPEDSIASRHGEEILAVLVPLAI